MAKIVDLICLYAGFNGSITVQVLRPKAVPLCVVIGSVKLALDDPPPSCVNPPMEGNYTNYTYSVFDTPVVRSLTQQASANDIINIYTEQISEVPEDNTFTIGGKPCLSTEPVRASLSQSEPDYSRPITSVRMYTNASFRCTLPDLKPGGYRVALHVSGKGWSYMNPAYTTVLIQPAITNNSFPNSGSLRGGLLIEIPVTGISPVDVAITRVTIGNTPCRIQRIYEDDRLTCLTQAAQDNGYSSLITHSNALAYWSLQSDYFQPNGSTAGHDGTTHFQSGGSLGTVANASIHGDIKTRTEGISGNNITDQSAMFTASYIEVPALKEFTNPTGFGYELWVREIDSQNTARYRIIVDSASFSNDASSGYILALNPCNEMEFWLSTGSKLSNVSRGSHSGCSPITNLSYCSQPCDGYAYIEDSGLALVGEVPPGIWHVIRSSGYDWTVWHQIAFGWEAECLDECSQGVTPSNGTQTLYIDATRISSSSSTYHSASTTPIRIGGSHRIPVGTPVNSTYDMAPFVGWIDEVSFYSIPLTACEISEHHFYGTTENQPIWVTVEGQDGLGTEVGPNLAYQGDTVPASEEQLTVNWNFVQDGVIALRNATALSFVWTG